MSNRTNRRENILEVAGRLFLQQGYEGTSVQQIADEVGCTKAALYYHFKAGKDEILHKMMQMHRPDLSSILDACTEATSLRELLQCWAKGVAREAPQRMAQFRWISSQYPKLNQEQQAKVHQIQSGCIHKFSDLIEPFVASRPEAERLALLVFCTTVGYKQLFLGLGLASAIDSSLQDQMEALADYISAGC
jgi:AcrR family transcriptional regulator